MIAVSRKINERRPRPWRSTIGLGPGTEAGRLGDPVTLVAARRLGG